MELEDLKEKWEDIFFTLKRHECHDEKILQQAVEETILPSLNWKQFKGEVVRPEITFGSASKGIPDAVLCKDGINYLVIELKRLTTPIQERAEKQLFSYMQNLKVSFGIIIGQTINLYYDNIIDKKPPIKIKTFEISENNNDIVELIKNLYKNNFSQENFENYCKEIISENNKRKDNESKIDFLCSEKGVNYVKELLKIEYPQEVVDSLNIKITNKNDIAFLTQIVNPIPYFQGYEPTYTYQSDKSKEIKVHPAKVIDERYEIRPTEKIQDYVKRILIQLERENKLTENELELLQTKQYSKETFGTVYSLLSTINIVAGGLHRYYSTFPCKDRKYMDKYYVCSQWSVQNTNEYVRKIAIWLNRILSED